MPYPNFHACRVEEPSKFKPKSFKTLTENLPSGMRIIVGILKTTGKSATQSFRYDKKIWSSARASKHCGTHNGKFEAAKVTKDIGEDESFLSMLIKDSGSKF